MSAYTSFLVKAILFDAFIMYQSYKMLKSGEIDFNILVFNNTIGKYTMCIFYGFFSIVLDSGILRRSWSELSIVRCTSRTQWILRLFKDIFISQIASVFAAFILVLLNAALFRIKINISFDIILYFIVLFLYLSVLNVMIAFAMSVLRKPEISLGVGILFNAFVLISGHRLFEMSIIYKKFLFVTAVTLGLLSLLTAYIMKARDIYTSKNASYIFEK